MTSEATLNRPTMSVGVDVDSLWHYYRIHGLDDRDAQNEAWAVGVPRFLELFRSLDLSATFYCVAEDLDLFSENREILHQVIAEGHEIGNHTWRHPYALTHLSQEDQAMEICEGKRRLEDHGQVEVVGFRAPGYHSHATLQPTLAFSGHLYETSAFPCVPYYLAKLGVIGLMKLRGKRSQSLIGDPRILWAPRRPYIASPHAPYRSSRDPEIGLRHFPISVWSGIPLIGGALTTLGSKWAERVSRWAARGLSSGDHLTIEFHAADLLGVQDDQLDKALLVQPDLRVSPGKKREIFTHALKAMMREAEPLRLDALERRLRA